MSHFKGKYKSVAELTPILEMQLGQITPRPQLKFSSKTSFDTYICTPILEIHRTNLGKFILRPRLVHIK